MKKKCQILIGNTIKTIKTGCFKEPHSFGEEIEKISQISPSLMEHIRNLPFFTWQRETWASI